jgi:hypothetical protein
MENLWRRLKYYGIGFSIGIIFVIFFFQNRGCSWLPGNRVKNSVLDRLIVMSDDTEAVLKKKGISKEDIVGVLNDGDVEFGESNKDAASKVYIIEKDGIKYAFTLPYESFISEVFIEGDASKVKNSSKGFGSIIHYPADENLVYPDSTTLMTCQQEELGLIEPKKIFDLIKKSGKFDFEKSKLDERPKPMHYLVFTHKNKQLGAKVIWYKNKLNITSFVSEDVNGCR